jgi:hypothetical protein
MELAIAAALCVGVILFTLLVRDRDIPEAPPVSPVQHLEERKAQIYENLRDLQFEYRVGKLSDDDYQKTKQDLQRELAKVMSEIDAILPAHAKAPPVAHAAPVAKLVAVTPDVAGLNGLVCHSCGAKFEHAMKFCGECGKAMA